MKFTTVAALLAALFFSSNSFAQNGPPEKIPVENFGALQKNSMVRISPDGQHFAILSFIDGVRYVVITPFGKDPIEVIPPYDDMTISWINWANNETLLIQMTGDKEAHSAFGKINVNRLISYNIFQKKPKDMAKAAKVKGSKIRTYMSNSSNVIDMLPSEPNKFLLVIDEDGTDMSREVRKVDVKNGNYSLIMDFYGDVQNWMTDTQGNLRLGTGIRRVGQGRGEDEFVMYYLNPNSGSWDEYTHSDASNYNIAGFFEDPRFAYAFGRNEEGFRVLYKYDMVNQEEVETIVEVKKYDLGALLFDRGTQAPIGVYFETTKPNYFYFDEELSILKAMIDQALPNSINTFGSWTDDRKKFIIHSSSDVNPGAYYLFDKEKQKLTFIETSYEGLDSKLLSPVRKIKYSARDELRIPALLTLPKDTEAKNLPTVILPHGGPQARDVWGYDFLAQFLASRGYAVLQPNFRGSTGYGREYAKLGRQEWGLKMQDDLTDGANYMVEKGYADPNRMCIMGWSYGGYAALTATVQTPDLFKCSISINGVSDLLMLMYDDSNFLGLQNWGTHIGDPGEDKTKLKETSAYHNIEKIKMPVLVIATRDDTRVNYNQSKKFADEMQDKGKWVKYIEIKEGGHGALEGDGRTVILREIERFLNQFIGSGG